MPPPRLYKYIPTNGVERILKRDPTVRFTPPDELNDPCEFIPVTTPLLQTMAIMQQREYTRRYGESSVSLEQQLPWINADNAILSWQVSLGIPSGRIGILSLSADPRSTLLWAHYASNSKGIAVGFDFDSPTFRNSKVDESSGPIAVQYQQDRVHELVADEATAREADHPAYYLTKGCSWRHEQEYRCFRLLRDTQTYRDIRGIVTFDHAEIKEVIFGVGLLTGKADEIENRLNALESWKNLAPEVPFSVAVPHPERFDMDILPAPPIDRLRRLAAPKD